MMTIMGKQFNRRGVSVIIAALLLIAIAVAAAVLLYVFSIGLMGSLGSSGGQQTKDQVILEAYNWGTPPSLSTLNLNIRNVGSSSLDLKPNTALSGADADYYFNGVLQLSGGLSTCSTSVAPQASCTIPFTALSPAAQSGVSGVVKVVTPDGGVFSYTVVGLQSG